MLLCKTHFDIVAVHASLSLKTICKYNLKDGSLLEWRYFIEPIAYRIIIGYCGCRHWLDGVVSICNG